MSIETKSMININSLSSSQEEDKEQKLALAQEAIKFLQNHKWCRNIKDGWFCNGWEDLIAVFLFEIIPIGDKADNEVWIINGDLPPAYIDVESAKNGIEVIKCYVGLMEDWINCIKNNLPTDNCYPIGVPPTLEYVNMLNNRIKIIKEEILN